MKINRTHIMKKFFLYTIAMLLVIIQCSIPSPDIYRSDTEDIKKIIQEEEISWNKGNAEIYSLHFAKDGVFTNILGQHFIGHTEFLTRHQQIFKGIFRGTVMQQSIVTLKFVHKDVVIVETLTQISGLLKSVPLKGIYIDEKGILKTRLLQVIRKEKKDWKITAYHNVDIKNEIPVPKDSTTTK
jgi:uncharacterized protein (TIGR02246 family)